MKVQQKRYWNLNIYLKTLFYFIFNLSVYPQISSTKSGPQAELDPSFGQVINLDLLLCTGFYLEHAVLFLCHIFTQRPMNDRKIKQRDGLCLGQQQLLANSIKNFISHAKKSDLSLPNIYKALNLFDSWRLKLSKYSKSGSTFSSSEQVASCSDCSRLWNALCLM